MVPYYILVLFLVVYVKGNAKVDTHIVGGEKAPNGAFPWQVSLRNITNGNAHYCGGSIIGKKWILTSAQCASRMNASTLAVVAGSNKLSSGGKKFEVDEIKIYDKYNPTYYLGDVGLIKLKTEIEYSDDMKAIQIDDQYLENRTACLVSGWGKTNINGTAKTDDLKMLKVTTMTPDECKRKLSIFYDSSRLCGVNAAGQGICQGDLGGPLVEGNKQVGIASYYISCANSRYPDIYTRVSSFAEWINENAKD